MSNKIPQIITPEGRTEWLKAFTPDYKFNENGEFGCTLNMENAVALPLMAQLDEYMEKAIADAMEETGKSKDKIKTNPPYTIDDETGDVSFKFKLKALVNGRNGDFTQKPLVIDARKQVITEEVPTWNGSRVRIGFQPITYYTGLVGAGVSLRMKTVQLIEALDGGGGAGNAASGFDVEDGFEFTASQPIVSPTSAPSLEAEFDDVPF
tara:strand:- start:12809 stop:13432 length:624 start_codon:yes stop_codon:yes gene_type:complete